MNAGQRAEADRLRAVPLEAVLRLCGAEQDREDRHKWRTAAGVLSVTDAKFINWSRGTGGGGAIDLVIDLQNVRFAAARDWLGCHFERGFSPAPAPPTLPRNLLLPPPDPSTLVRVHRYLANQRGIDSTLIDTLSRQHTAVEAGDFLRVLEGHSKLHRVELTAIRRQENKAYRAAVRCMAAGAARAGLERLDALGWVQEGRAGYLRGAVGDFMRLSDNGRNLDQILAVTPTWAEHEAFTAELRTQLKATGALGRGENITTHEPLKWTIAQAKDARNYEAGMVVTFNEPVKGFSAGEFFEVSRVAEGSVFVRAGAGERQLPLRSGAFSVARARQLEVAAGDRLLVRANDRRSGVLNGEIVTVEGIEAGVIQTADGRRIDSRRFGEFTYGYAVTSHASQSKTVAHVVVAAERLTAKAAYVACSRGRVSCAVHTPDKAALLDRLPDGNREAALDLLGADHSLARKALDRTLAWAQSAGSRARMLPEALRRIAARVLHRKSVILGPHIRETHGPQYRLDLGAHHSSTVRPDRGPSLSL